MQNEIFFQLLKSISGKMTENTEVKSFFDDFLSASVAWVRPLFLKPDGAPQPAVTDLQKEIVTDEKLKEIAGELAAKVAPSQIEIAALTEFLASKPDTGSKTTILTNNEKFVNDSTIHGGVKF